jgi:hypothetical protein
MLGANMVVDGASDQVGLGLIDGYGHNRKEEDQRQPRSMFSKVGLEKSQAGKAAALHDGSTSVVELSISRGSSRRARAVSTRLRAASEELATAGGPPACIHHILA